MASAAFVIGDDAVLGQGGERRQNHEMAIDLVFGDFRSSFVTELLCIP